jgi:hypothetical protein
MCMTAKERAGCSMFTDKSYRSFAQTSLFTVTNGINRIMSHAISYLNTDIRRDLLWVTEKPAHQVSGKKHMH